MKSLIVALAISLLLSASAYASDEGAMMPMRMCQQMMNQSMAMGQGMMMKDMMQMMMDMMNMQEKMMMGLKPSEKKQMMMDMAQMKERMQKMMSMGIPDGPEPKLKCAEEWLKKAIDLHEIHLKDPKTATEASQMEMMDQMKHAYECITGGPSEKTDPHKH